MLEPPKPLPIVITAHLTEIKAKITPKRSWPTLERRTFDPASSYAEKHDKNMASVSASARHPWTAFLSSLACPPSSQTGGFPHLSHHITWLQSKRALADKLGQFMRTGDQCRGGKAGAKCQQMGPEVVQDYILAWGVKQKESAVPRGRRNIHTNNFFLSSFWQRQGKMMERMLAANCIL